MLKFAFINERVTDADGVSRDTCVAFWMNSAAEGVEIWVPSLSPKWQGEEWKAVGRIFVKGFLDQGYFLLRLAPGFTTALIFGEHAVSTDSLFESFMLCLSQCERELITAALEGDLDGDGQDELLVISSVGTPGSESCSITSQPRSSPPLSGTQTNNTAAKVCS